MSWWKSRPCGNPSLSITKHFSPSVSYWHVFLPDYCTFIVQWISLNLQWIFYLMTSHKRTSVRNKSEYISFGCLHECCPAFCERIIFWKTYFNWVYNMNSANTIVLSLYFSDVSWSIESIPFWLMERLILIQVSHTPGWIQSPQSVSSSSPHIQW